MHSDIADIDYLDRGECDGMAVRNRAFLRGQTGRNSRRVTAPFR